MSLEQFGRVNTTQVPRRAIRSCRWVLVLSSLFAVAFHARIANCQTLPPGALRSLIKQRAKDDVARNRAAESIATLIMLYGKDADQNGMNAREIESTYRAAYDAATDDLPLVTRVYRKLSSTAGIAVWIALAIIGWFKDALKSGFSKASKWVGDQLAVKCANNRWVQRASIKKYRSSIVTKNEKLKVSFRPDRPLDVRRIFVPLKAHNGSDKEAVEIFNLISEHRRLMIVGAPGSGKSMLLRQLALTYCETGLIEPVEFIPILFELHHLNEDTRSIHENLVDVLKQNAFPNGSGFLNASAKSGRLLVLFDGLDEVSSQHRSRVVKQIQDYLAESPKVQAIITCRTAVYHQEFVDCVDQTVEIDEFNDEQVWRFLEAWRDEMPPDKSITQLMLTLRDRPHILALARNPLLLTIIAYLYCDTEFVLPHSRTEFYTRATAELLDHWHFVQNKFQASKKRLVLQHLALFMQAGGDTESTGSKTLDLQTVIRETCRVLPTLNLKPEEAQPIINEIVERSGLLLAIDGGERYQFAHLTLQEFFSALALRDDAAGLKNRFLKDRSAWRETLKLWCGLEINSTEVIDAVYQADPVTALEALADAQQVNAGLAERIETEMRPSLLSGSADQIVHGFGYLAADNRPRGKHTFEFLCDIVTSPTAELTAKRAVAEALSYSNLPQAADVLASVFQGDDYIKKSLYRMGDLAISAIVAASEDAPSDEALEDLIAALVDIATPNAAIALTHYLWEDVKHRRIYAAWGLSALFSNPGVESALESYTLPPTAYSREWSWVWHPFSHESNAPISVIAGRIVQILSEATGVLPKRSRRVDERLLIPLCLNYGTGIHDVASRLPLLEGQIIEQSPLSLREYWTGEAATIAYALCSSPSELVNNLTGRWRTSTNHVTKSNWENIFRPDDFSYRRSVHLYLFLFVLVCMSLLTVIGIVETTSGFTRLTSIIVCLCLGMFQVAFCYISAEDHDPDVTLKVSTMASGLLGTIIVGDYEIMNCNLNPLKVRERLKTESYFTELGLSLLVVCMSIYPIVQFYIVCSLRAAVPGGMPAAVGFMIFGFAAAITALVTGCRREMNSRNPLRGLLDHRAEEVKLMLGRRISIRPGPRVSRLFSIFSRRKI